MKKIISAVLMMILSLSGCKSEPPCECKGEWHKVLLLEAIEEKIMLHENTAEVLVRGYDFDLKKILVFYFLSELDAVECAGSGTNLFDYQGCIDICVTETESYLFANAWHPTDDPGNAPESIKVESTTKFRPAYISNVELNGKGLLDVTYFFCDETDTLAENMKIATAIQPFDVDTEDNNCIDLLLNWRLTHDYRLMMKIAENRVLYARASSPTKESVDCNERVVVEIKKSKIRDVLGNPSKDIGITWVETGTNKVSTQMYPWELIEKEVLFANMSKTKKRLLCYRREFDDFSGLTSVSSTRLMTNEEPIYNSFGRKNPVKGKYNSLNVIQLEPYQEKKLFFPVTSKNYFGYDNVFENELNYYFFIADKNQEVNNNYDMVEEKYSYAGKLTAEITLLNKSAATEVAWDISMPISELRGANESSKIGEIFSIDNKIIICVKDVSTEYESQSYVQYFCIDAATGNIQWNTDVKRKYDKLPLCEILAISEDKKHIEHLGHGTDQNEGIAYRINIDSGKFETMEKPKSAFSNFEHINKIYRNSINTMLSIVNTWKTEKRNAFFKDISNYYIDLAFVFPKLVDNSYYGPEFLITDDKILYFVNDELMYPSGMNGESFNLICDVVLCFDKKTGDKLYQINYQSFDCREESVAIHGNYLLLKNDLFDMRNGSYLGKYNNKIIKYSDDYEEAWKRKCIGNNVLLYTFGINVETKSFGLKLLKILK